MTRFFVGSDNISSDRVFLGPEDAEHVKVLRMKIGERFIVCDGAGRDYLCCLGEASGREAWGEILDSYDCPAEPSVYCRVFAAYPKGDRSDYIVQKCTELGVSEIVFFNSACSVSRPEGKSVSKKILRWQRIAHEAAKQSGRGRIPVVSAVSGFEDAVAGVMETRLPMMMYELGSEGRLALRSVLKTAGTAGGFESVGIITGPEGGFTAEEAGYALGEGVKLCSMGPRILRCETAPVAALTAVMLFSGNLD